MMPVVTFEQAPGILLRRSRTQKYTSLPMPTLHILGLKSGWGWFIGHGSLVTPKAGISMQ